MKIIRDRHAVIFLLSVVLLHIGACHTSRSNRDEVFFKVTRVVDGDTFWIDNGTESGEKIRLIGVDAPETRKTGRKEIGYYGKHSKKYLTDLLLGNEVRLEHDVDHKDRYERTLAYVYLRNGTFVNAELVKGGYAMVLTIPPNVRHANEFAALQSEAREARRGLWGK